VQNVQKKRRFVKPVKLIAVWVGVEKGRGTREGKSVPEKRKGGRGLRYFRPHGKTRRVAKKKIIANDQKTQKGTQRKKRKIQ